MLLGLSQRDVLDAYQSDRCGRQRSMVGKNGRFPEENGLQSHGLHPE